LHQHFVFEPKVVSRFEQEAILVLERGLTHPNLTQVLDHGRGQDGIPFIILSWVEGFTVAHLIDTRGPLPSDETVHIARGVLAGLSFAHAHGVIHRDIKPANIMVTPDRLVKVMDFGIAKEGDLAGVSASSSGNPGTWAYIAPEQISGESMDGRTDLYALGATLYHMLAGRVPFEGPTVIDYVRQHLYEAPRPILELVPGVDEQLAAIIQRAMAKKPADRFPSAIWMAEELGTWVPAELATAPIPAPIPPPVSPPDEPRNVGDGASAHVSNALGAAASDAPDGISRRALLRVGLGAIGIVSVGGLAALAVRAHAPDVNPTPGRAPSPLGTSALVVAGPSAGPTFPASTATAAPIVVARPTAAPTAAPTVIATPVAGDQFSLSNPPAVSAANIASAKPYAGAEITYYGDGVGMGNDLDKAAATQFQKDTGIKVNVVARPQSSTDTFSQYQRFFQGQSPDLDVLMLDVIWPGQLASNLADLGPKLGDATKQHYPGIVENDTIRGTLVAMPFFSDFGILYYRSDLLQKYNISAPPKTWDELGQQAAAILNGEKAASPNFVGFVFQGSAYEGLTCDALEWLASSGGGMIVENGKATMNNPQAIAILNTMKGWVGTVAPRGVTTYQEEDARTTFQAGYAAFMRNWPYAYALGAANDSPVKGKFDVAPLPAVTGQQPVGCIGGWGLAVSKYSKSPDASIEFVRYLSSPDVQTFRGVVGGFVPTIPIVVDNPAVQQAQPYLAKVGSVTRVARPSAETGDSYNQVSTTFFEGVNNILNGQDAASVLATTQNQIQRLLS
jgi:trehalose/maltose transport system substrate-binding protein